MAADRGNNVKWKCAILLIGIAQKIRIGEIRMEENKNQQTEILNEEQLNEVAGGNNDLNCYFEPEKPASSKLTDGVLRAKCKSRCGAEHAGVMAACIA